jgi:hypothetical protein
MGFRWPTLVSRIGTATAALAFSTAWSIQMLPGARAADDSKGPVPATRPFEVSCGPGRRVVSAVTRPDITSTPVVACSFSQPLCVHAPSSFADKPLLRVLEAAERAARAYRAMGLPQPLPDGNLGGGPEFDIYVVPRLRRAVTIEDGAPTRNVWSLSDQAHAFTLLPPPFDDSGCRISFEVARALGDAICLGLNAGVDAGTLAMASSYLASVVASCDVVELSAVDEFQQHPERSLFVDDATVDDATRAQGSHLFPWFLDDAYGRGGVANVMLGAIALADRRTPPGAWTWVDKPNVVDVLSATMKSHASTFDALLLDFAVARAFGGDRSDGAHLVGTERYGASGRARLEWEVPYNSLPRRLAPRAPIEPTGATYLWVDARGAAPGAGLTFVADWEVPAVFRWSLVKVDQRGASVGRVDVATVFGSTHVERTVVDLDELGGVLVVGVNAGSADRSHPFDPGEQPLMPHGYAVTLFP